MMGMTDSHVLQMLGEQLDIPAAVLRAIYDMNGRSIKELLIAVRENTQGEWGGKGGEGTQGE